MSGCDRVLADIAQRNLGLVPFTEAKERGVTPHQIRRRIEGGELVPVHPGVARLAGVQQTWEQEILAICIWAGKGWAASGLGAGRLWDLDAVGRGRLEISGRGRISKPRPGIVVHERCIFLPGDITTRSGIPVTSPARTLIDLPAILDAQSLERAFESAIRRGYVTPEYLMRRMRRLGTKGRKRITNLVEVLVRRGDVPPSDSDFEIRLIQVLRAAGLPPPVRQREMFDAHGFIARVDFIYPLAKLILEADSFRHHGGRLDWENDNDQRRRLAALGYRVLPITWRMLTSDPQRVQALVRDALRSTP